MAQFCVFCGNKPVEKTKEHVLPRWLIELTGDPHREGFFNFDVTKTDMPPRMFSFDSFAFPACDECNQDFSGLEARSKDVVVRLLKGNELDCVQLHTLMDWLDKVRIGLWLAFNYLDKNSRGIIPQFHIEKRVGLIDRGIILFRTDYANQTLNFIGPECPLFQNVPISTAFVINNYVVVSQSHLGLCDRRLGFPFSEVDLVVDGKSRVTVQPGFERVWHPIQRGLNHPHCTGLYQTIFGQILESESRSHCDTKYVKDNSLDWDKGQSWIFLQRQGAVERYPSTPSLDWLPPIVNMGEALRYSRRIVWRTQIDRFSEDLKITDISPEDRALAEAGITAAKRMNQLLGPKYDEAYRQMFGG